MSCSLDVLQAAVRYALRLKSKVSRQDRYAAPKDSMPSHRAALYIPLEVLRSCNLSPKNGRLVCRFSLAHRVLRNFLPCQPAQPVFGCFPGIQGSTPKWTQEAG